MNTSIDTFLRRSMLAGIVAILLVIPFHAFVTVWLSSAVDNYTLLRLWKEGVLAVLAVVTVWFLVRHPLFVIDAMHHRILRLLFIYTGAYIALTIMLGLFAIQQGNAESLAVGYSYVSNLRFLVFFVICLVAAVHFRGFFVKYWQQLLLVPASVVVVFAVLQFLVLPHDVLRLFGYGPDTIQPFITVDNKVEFTRAQSTLRGPNPLGAYLVIVAVAIASLWLLRKQRTLLLGGAVTGIALLATYSRSAWIGALLAVGLACLLLVRSNTRKAIYVASAIAVVVGALLVFALRDNDTAQNVLFHTDETSQSQTSSNEDRANALTGGAGDIGREPFGRGPGTAGPASVHNAGNARISENYFLQIGQEVGIIGLTLFVAICGLIGKLLWDVRRQSVLPVLLLTSFVGLTAVNFLSHAWADDTLAYIWWGFAGMAIGMHMFDSKKGKRA